MISYRRNDHTVLTDFLRLMPGFKCKQRIGSHNKIVFRIRMLYSHFLQSFACITVIFPKGFFQRKFKMRIVCNGTANHINTFLNIRTADTVWLVRRIGRRHKKYFLQPKLMPGIFAEDQMPDVDGIKGSSHDPNFSCFFFLQENASPQRGSSIFFLSSFPSL